MGIRDIVTISSVVALIIGWFVNGYLNRKNEIARKRLDYRLLMLQEFFKVWFFITKNSNPFSDPSFLPLVENVRGQFHLYGKEDEIALLEIFIKSCEAKELGQANNALAKLVPLIRTRLRKELNIKTNLSFKPST